MKPTPEAQKNIYNKIWIAEMCILGGSDLIQFEKLPIRKICLKYLGLFGRARARGACAATLNIFKNHKDLKIYIF